MPNKEISDAEEYATRGPFTAIFESSIARILDQTLVIGNMEQTISMLADSTNLSYKTVKKGLEKLQKMGIVVPTRKIGNAQAYQFLVKNELHELIKCGQKLQLIRKDV